MTALVLSNENFALAGYTVDLQNGGFGFCPRLTLETLRQHDMQSWGAPRGHPRVISLALELDG